jgi:hypothetical protein
MAKEPNRSINTKQDLGAIDAIQHNDAVGAKKVMVVEATIVRATAASENVGAGRLVKLSATPYGLDLVGKVYAPAATYQRGDVVSETASVYLAQEDNITGTFDATKWRKVADKVIAGIPSAVGAVVSTGRWHNAVTVAGWLVDDESAIEYTRIRD